MLLPFLKKYIRVVNKMGTYTYALALVEHYMTLKQG